MENPSAKNLDLKVLCVDDELDILELYRDLVLQAGFTPILMQDSTAAIDAIKTDLRSIVLVISDYRLAGPTSAKRPDVAACADHQ